MANGTEKTRREVTRKKLFDAAGAETKDYRKAVRLVLEIIGAGDIEIEPRRWSEEVQNACMLFGANIVTTNTLGGLAGEEAYDAAMARIETLESGEWADRKGAQGPRISTLAEAVVAVMTAAGQDAEIGAIKEKLLGMTPEAREKWSNQPQVKAEIERIKAEAAAKRAAEAKAKADAAGEPGAGAGDDLLTAFG